MKPKVLLINQLPNDIFDQLNDQCELIPFYDKDVQMYEHLDTIEGILGSKMIVNRKLLEKTPKLRIISNISVGYDNLNIEDIKQFGVMATNTPDILTQTTADLMFGLILATARRIPELDQYVKTGQWIQPKINQNKFGMDVYGKKLGIIGMGKIGVEIAKRGYFGFHMDIYYHNRTKRVEAEEELDATYMDLEELLQSCDYILVMAPLSEETYHLIAEVEFDLMSDHAIFINGSRGEIVDENALINALEQKKILAAGLDVYTVEPPSKNNPLLSMNNVTTLPHIGSATTETRSNMAKRAGMNLIDGLMGKTPKDLITS